MTLTNQRLRPLRQQNQLAQLCLIASLTVGVGGLAIGVVGMAKRSPIAILMGYGCLSPALVCGLLSNHASIELRRRLATATKNQAAIDQQIKTAWQQGHESGRTETLSELAQRDNTAPSTAPNLTKPTATQHPAPVDRSGEIINLTQQLKAAKGELQQAQQNLTTAQNTNANHLKSIAAIESELATAQDKVQAIEQKRYELENLQRELQANHESQHQRELNLARNEAQAQLLQTQLNERDRKQDELERQIQQLNEEYSQALIAEQNEGYNAGIEAATGQYSLMIERQQATIEKLQARLNQLNAYTAQNRALPTLENLIGKLKKPAFITAGQGAGKALHSAELCRIWSEGAESVCAFVLDISEGGNEASSWSRMGIPVTDDPDLFIQVMGAVRAKLTDTQSCLPWRNNPDQYRESPPIVLIIDEALTSFDGQSNGAIQAIIDGLAAIESRGSKRKVFCIACSTDDQIQNISATSDKGKAMKLWNTGRLKNYYRLYLNDALLHRATDDELKANKGLGDYLNTYGGSHFISALESFDSKGKFLKPFKHVSHHSHLLSETKPSYSPELNLVCPEWFPEAAKALFGGSPPSPQPDTPSSPHQAPTKPPKNPHANLEALLLLDCAKSPTENGDKTRDMAECPHCHTVARHNIKARNKKTGQVSRWQCKNKSCKKSFKAE